MRILFFVIFVLLSAFSFSDNLLKKDVYFKTRFETNRFYIYIDLFGSEKWYLLDTGTTTSIIFSDIKIPGLNYIKTDKHFDQNSGKVEDVKYYAMNDIENEYYSFKDFEIIQKKRNINLSVDGQLIAGVIGLNFFSQYFLNYDENKREISLTVAPLHTNGRIELQKHWENLPELPVIWLSLSDQKNLNSPMFPFLIDTGTPLDFGVPEKFINSGTEKIILIRNDSSLQNDMKIGKLRTPTLQGIWNDNFVLNSPLEGMLVKFDLMTLGSGILGYINWSLGFAAGEVFLETSSETSRFSSRHILGIFTYSFENGNPDMLFVVKGDSLAEKSGLQPGDQIYQWNGLEIISIPEQYQPGDVLSFKRGEKIIEVRMP